MKNLNIKIKEWRENGIFYFLAYIIGIIVMVGILKNYIGVGDPVIASISAALITLMGVQVTAKNTQKNLDKQLLHQQQEKDKDRKLAIKHEKYFEMVNYLNELDRLISTEYIIADEVKETSFKVIGLAQLINTTSIVASREIVIELSQLYQDYTSINIDLTSHLQKLTTLNQQAKGLRDAFNLSQSMLKTISDRFIVETDDEEIRKLNIGIQIHGKNIEKLVNDLNVNVDLRDQEKSKITEIFNSRLQKVRVKKDRMLDLITRELGYTK